MPGRLLITLQRQASAMRGLKHKRSSSHLLLWRSGESESTTTITDLCDARPLINDCRRNSALTRRLQAWSMLARWSASSSWHWSCIWAHLATKNQIEIKPWISCPISVVQDAPFLFLTRTAEETFAGALPSWFWYGYAYEPFVLPSPCFVPGAMPWHSMASLVLIATGPH